MCVDFVVHYVSLNHQRHKCCLKHGHGTREAKCDPDRDEHTCAVWRKLAQNAHLILRQNRHLLQVTVLNVPCMQLQVAMAMTLALMPTMVAMHLFICLVYWS